MKQDKTKKENVVHEDRVHVLMTPVMLFRRRAVKANTRESSSVIVMLIVV